MGIWMELRCDSLKSPRCWSNQNNGPMHMVSSNMARVRDGVRRLHEEARAKGWVRSRVGSTSYAWSCPECAKQS